MGFRSNTDFSWAVWQFGSATAGGNSAQLLQAVS